MLENGEASLDRLASELGMSRATLQRRLKAEGTSFEAILDGLRQRLARRYLRKREFLGQEDRLLARLLRSRRLLARLQALDRPQPSELRA